MNNKLLGVVLGVGLLSVPFMGIAQSLGVKTVPVEAAQEVNPNVVVGNFIDVFPAVPSNFAGLDSILILSNFLNNDAALQVCTLPAGGTSLGCTGIGLGPRETLFLGLGNLQQASVSSGTTAQLQVSALNQATFAMSAIVTFNETGGINYIVPFQFQAQ